MKTVKTTNKYPDHSVSKVLTANCTGWTWLTFTTVCEPRTKGSEENDFCRQWLPFHWYLQTNACMYYIYPTIICASYPLRVTGGGEAVHPGQAASVSQCKQLFTLTFTPSCNIESKINLTPQLHCFGLWEEAGNSTGRPNKLHTERPWLHLEPSGFEATVLTT